MLPSLVGECPKFSSAAKDLLILTIVPLIQSLVGRIHALCLFKWNQYSTSDPEICYTTATLTHYHYNVMDVYDIDEERNVEWRCLEIFETSGCS